MKLHIFNSEKIETKTIDGLKDLKAIIKKIGPVSNEKISRNSVSYNLTDGKMMTIECSSKEECLTIIKGL